MGLCEMMLFPLVLALFTEALPAMKLECSRDEAGNCLQLGLSPLAKLHPVDHARASSIYNPYWVCYWTTIRVHQNFGTSDPRLAVAIFESATGKCADLKAAADHQMDDFLLPQTVYGSEEHKRFVRDHFRRSAGQTFLEQSAMAEAQNDALIRTLTAYQQFESHNN